MDEGNEGLRLGGGGTAFDVHVPPLEAHVLHGAAKRREVLVAILVLRTLRARLPLFPNRLSGHVALRAVVTAKVEVLRVPETGAPDVRRLRPHHLRVVGRLALRIRADHRCGGGFAPVHPTLHHLEDVLVVVGPFCGHRHHVRALPYVLELLGDRALADVAGAVAAPAPGHVLQLHVVVHERHVRYLKITRCTLMTGLLMISYGVVDGELATQLVVSVDHVRAEELVPFGRMATAGSVARFLVHAGDVCDVAAVHFAPFHQQDSLDLAAHVVRTRTERQNGQEQQCC